MAHYRRSFGRVRQETCWRETEVPTIIEEGMSAESIWKDLKRQIFFDARLVFDGSYFVSAGDGNDDFSGITNHRVGAGHGQAGCRPMAGSTASRCRLTV